MTWAECFDLASQLRPFVSGLVFFGGVAVGVAACAAVVFWAGWEGGRGRDW